MMLGTGRPRGRPIGPMPTISDLQRLIAPLTEAQFLTLLRERKLTFLPSSDRRRFETLLSWEALNHLLDGGTFPLERLRVLRESTHIPTILYVKKGRVVSTALSKLLDQGVSLIFNQLERYVPALHVLCRNIARHTSEGISAAAVLTNGRGGALACHRDDEDLIILQIVGTKRWQVFGPSVVAGHPPPGPPVFDHLLRAGDVLFLPSGQWHGTTSRRRDNQSRRPVADVLQRRKDQTLANASCRRSEDNQIFVVAMACEGAASTVRQHRCGADPPTCLPRDVPTQHSAGPRIFPVD